MELMGLSLQNLPTLHDTFVLADGSEIRRFQPPGIYKTYVNNLVGASNPEITTFVYRIPDGNFGAFQPQPVPQHPAGNLSAFGSQLEASMVWYE